MFSIQLPGKPKLRLAKIVNAEEQEERLRESSLLLLQPLHGLRRAKELSVSQPLPDKFTRRIRTSVEVQRLSTSDLLAARIAYRVRNEPTRREQAACNVRHRTEEGNFGLICLRRGYLKLRISRFGLEFVPHGDICCRSRGWK
jgi:hypothetical protein